MLNYKNYYLVLNVIFNNHCYLINKISVLSFIFKNLFIIINLTIFNTYVLSMSF